MIDERSDPGMIDACLVFFLVTLVPIAFPLQLGEGTERVLFLGWRGVQAATLALAFVVVIVQLIRARWCDRVLVLLLVVAMVFAALSYTYIEFDSQIEYHRVLLLADRYHGLWNGYRHGISGWIVGYPPGTSLSIMWYRWLELPSPNMAQGVLVVLWFATFLTRYMRNIGTAGKLLFSAMLFTAPLVQWHMTFFYNNLFFALFWAQLVLAPLFDAPQRPWERCASALVLVWLRPQWQLAAIPIVSAALASLLSLRRFDRRHTREVILTTLAALLIVFLGATYWARTAAKLGVMLSNERAAVERGIAAQQDPAVLHLEVEGRPVPPQAPTAAPPLLSHKSAHAVYWAWLVTIESYALGVVFLCAATLLALIALRWRGLVYLVPLFSPGGIILGTAFFARTFGDYKNNSWALERLQIIVPILAAGVAAALHRHLVLNSDSKSTRSNKSSSPPTPAL